MFDSYLICSINRQSILSILQKICSVQNFALANYPDYNPSTPVLKICFGPPTAESKNLKNHVNFDVGDLFFRSPALWSSQNVFGPPTAGRVVVDFKDREGRNNQKRDLHRVI